MPTTTQYEVVKQQCKAFDNAGYPASFKVQPLANGAAPAIRIEGYFKQWHFCDPDWNVVSRQLVELWKNVKQNRKN